MSNELHRPGIYFLYSKRKRLVYIGKSVDLRNRIGKHYCIFENVKSRIKAGLRNFDNQVKPFEYFRYCFVPIQKLDFYEKFFIGNCYTLYTCNGIFILPNNKELIEFVKSVAQFAK